MDIGRISSAIKRKVIELVENGLRQRTRRWVKLDYCQLCGWHRKKKEENEQKEKNAAEAAFIALVVYIFLFAFF